MKPEYLIACLGNPGEKYMYTPHNVAWMFADSVVSSDMWHESKRARALFAHARLGDADVEFIKPLTYMNNSGGAVSYAQKKYAIPANHIIVIHDDVDLPFGEFKIAFNRGTGGHNGVASVAQTLKTKEFVRIKIGVQPERLFGLLKARRPKNTKSFVLRPFSKKNRILLEGVFPEIQKALTHIITQGASSAMNEYNKS